MALSVQEFLAAFGNKASAVDAQPVIAPAFTVDSGDKNAVRLNSALKGDNWHTNVRDLVASLVAARVSEEVIMALAPKLTLPGYTVEQTVSELRQLANSARRKGFANDGFPAHDEDHDDPLNGFSIVSAQELSSTVFPPIDWLIKPLLPRPALTMLAGPPKVGKSWLCLFFALQVAEDGHEVIYIASEDNDRRLKDRLLSVCPFPPDGIHFIAGLSSARTLPKGKAAHAFVKALKNKHPAMKCLVVDTLAAIRAEPSAKTRKDEYALSEEEFSGLRQLAHDLDIAIIIVHHTRKVTDSTASPVESILGSQGIAATVETIMVMKQETGSQNVGLYITGKDVEQQELVLPWQSPGFSWPREMTEARLGSFQQRCLEYIRSHPRCMQGALIAEFDRDKSQVSRAVATLIQRGLVSKKDGERLVAT